MKRAVLALAIVAAGAATASIVHAATTQYMAICTERYEHGGQEYPLGPWVYGYQGANNTGKAHEQATRGHRWRIAERQVP